MTIIPEKDMDVCYVCEKAIVKGDKIRYFYGPFIIHEECLERYKNDL